MDMHSFRGLVGILSAAVTLLIGAVVYQQDLVPSLYCRHIPSSGPRWRAPPLFPGFAHFHVPDADDFGNVFLWASVFNRSGYPPPGVLPTATIPSTVITITETATITATAYVNPEPELVQEWVQEYVDRTSTITRIRSSRLYRKIRHLWLWFCYLVNKLVTLSGYVALHCLYFEGFVWENWQHVLDHWATFLPTQWSADDTPYWLCLWRIIYVHTFVAMYSPILLYKFAEDPEHFKHVFNNLFSRLRDSEDTKTADTIRTTKTLHHQSIAVAKPIVYKPMLDLKISRKRPFASFDECVGHGESEKFEISCKLCEDVVKDKDGASNGAVRDIIDIENTSSPGHLMPYKEAHESSGDEIKLDEELFADDEDSVIFEAPSPKFEATRPINHIPILHDANNAAGGRLINFTWFDNSDDDGEFESVRRDFDDNGLTSHKVDSERSTVDLTVNPMSSTKVPLPQDVSNDAVGNKAATGNTEIASEIEISSVDTLETTGDDDIREKFTPTTSTQGENVESEMTETHCLGSSCASSQGNEVPCDDTGLADAQEASHKEDMYEVPDPTDPGQTALEFRSPPTVDMVSVERTRSGHYIISDVVSPPSLFAPPRWSSIYIPRYLSQLGITFRICIGSKDASRPRMTTHIPTTLVTFWIGGHPSIGNAMVGKILPGLYRYPTTSFNTPSDLRFPWPKPIVKIPPRSSNECTQGPYPKPPVTDSIKPKVNSIEIFYVGTHDREDRRKRLHRGGRVVREKQRKGFGIRVAQTEEDRERGTDHQTRGIERGSTKWRPEKTVEGRPRKGVEEVA